MKNRLWWAIAIIAITIYSCSAHGQAFKKSTIIELSAVSASIGADAYTTPWNNRLELNPVARPFVSSGGGRTAYFGGSLAVVILANRLLTNHPKAKHVLNWSIVAVETGWTVNNIRFNRITSSNCAQWRASGRPIPSGCL